MADGAPADRRSALVAEFVSVLPSCTEEQAAFYLEANQWELQAAMDSYYESQQVDENGGGGPAPSGLAATSAGALAGNLGPFVSGTGVDGPDPGAGRGAASGSGNRGSGPARGNPPHNRGRGGIMTFSDLAGSSGGDASEEEDGQNMFAGGKQSAMAVQNPDRGGGGNLVGDILRKAAQAGAAPPEEVEAPRQRSFVGTGYRLGSEDSPSEAVMPSGPAPEQPLPTVSRVLTFWRNGFSVDDGALYAYDDPANSELLAAINSGQAPLHVLNVLPGQPVNVNVAKRQDEDYVPPKPVLKAFSGGGQRLGGVGSGGVSHSAQPAQPPPSVSPAERSPAPAMSVDPSQPVTSLQIRLADGTRMLSKFNTTHTVADVRNFINASRVGQASRPYTLQTTFPTKDIDDEKLTLKDAGLLNAVVVQRLT